MIAREGLSGTTVRRVADELGGSTTAVTHYFASRDELLRAAVEDAYSTAAARMTAAAEDAAEDGALAMLAAALEQALPIDRTARDEARVGSRSGRPRPSATSCAGSSGAAMWPR